MFPATSRDADDADTSRKDVDFRYSPGEDHTRLEVKNTRKTRLTLGHINKLRLMNELRAIEKQQDLKRVRKQYAAPPAQGPGMQLILRQNTPKTAYIKRFFYVCSKYPCRYANPKRSLI